MYCPPSIRFNDGDLLHEAYVAADGSKIYSHRPTGEKASHGCVRVHAPHPRRACSDWDNRKKNHQAVIWEDWQGRQITVRRMNFPSCN